MPNPIDMDSLSAATTIEELRQENARLKEQIAELTAKVNWFMEQFNLMKRRQFGASSERTVPGQQQLSFFNEAESEAQPELAEPTVETITYKRRKERGQREEALKDLPVETIEYRLPPEEQVCPNCGGPLHEMSAEVRQEIKVIPAQVKLTKHVRYVYSCRRCEHEETSTPVVTAKAALSGDPGQPGFSLGRGLHHEQQIRGRSASLPPGAAVLAPGSGTLSPDHGQLGDVRSGQMAGSSLRPPARTPFEERHPAG
jgi:hypothetical protein